MQKNTRPLLDLTRINKGVKLATVAHHLPISTSDCLQGECQADERKQAGGEALDRLVAEGAAACEERRDLAADLKMGAAMRRVGEWAGALVGGMVLPGCQAVASARARKPHRKFRCCGYGPLNRHAADAVAFCRAQEPPPPLEPPDAATRAAR